MWKFAVLVLWAEAILAQNANEFREVNIAQGTVRGHLAPEGGLYSFFNIPYATAPTGPNRFKAPLDPPVWMHTFDAVDRNIACPQPTLPLLPQLGALNIQEDCLIANVFAPDTDATNLPVVVYIHPGAYQYGHGNIVSFNTFVKSNNFIVVTFNHRLGAHGFLCLGTEDIPGNAGLKDQVALLRWIQTNIASFGGNPHDVTLLGCSAGGGSIDFLTLSGITNGLFNKAIMGSGAVFGYVGAQADPLATAKNYASLLNFDNVDDIDALEGFYKAASFEDLYSRHLAISLNPNGTILFTPCVERDVGQERVLADAPINIITQGNYTKVPLMYGFANMEGMFAVPMFILAQDRMNEKFADFLPGELYFENEEVKEKVAETVKNFYFGGEPVSIATMAGYVDYFTDVLFSYPMLKALSARVESNNDEIYLFEYAFVDDNTQEIPQTGIKGANHCEQFGPLSDVDTSGVTAEFLQMQSVVQEYWVNFILTGNPSTQGSSLESWPPANANRGPYMSIGQTTELKDVLLEERTALWDSIYAEHYRAPIPPAGSAVSFIISKYLILLSFGYAMLYHLLI